MKITRKQMSRTVWHLSSVCPPEHEWRGEAGWGILTSRGLTYTSIFLDMGLE